VTNYEPMNLTQKPGLTTFYISDTLISVYSRQQISQCKYRKQTTSTYEDSNICTAVQWTTRRP